MRIGAHVDPTDPLAEAAARGAEAVQFFLADPQKFDDPLPREDAELLRASEVDVYIHAPYRLNLASLNNRIRIPSRKLLMTHARAAAAIGAKGLIVHGGHVDGGDLEAGFANWKKAFEYAEKDGGFPLPILIENTAGGTNACARRFDDLARLWDAVGGFGAGFCLDTCHAFAGGEDLVGIVDRLKAITGRIDLIHANDSKGGFDSGQDRHDNLGNGKIDPELVVAAIRASGAPAIVETPGGLDGQRADIALLRERSGV
ncbi:deoxyribonuclease IV [Actinoplanes sp. L3-i22]|uniref:deoxyribonuclease IV n=1 Tax=Actinoplanes sp. L3-i22 TaxID=2836373 RepID=UPI001C76432A|nr:deoxyribonuclease IV [Actinoplanes sp. L3-i22]BCY15613.1 deoxyribonuclease IV [Actinoplanes sp. L3-i22]